MDHYGRSGPVFLKYRVSSYRPVNYDLINPAGPLFGENTLLQAETRQGIS